MKILIVRHAKAKDKKNFARTGRPDTERPLTREGKKEMRKAARGLKNEVPSLTYIVSSPLVRARQTAAILQKTYRQPRLVEHDGLSPGADPGELLKWIRSRRTKGVAALVGHEPDLSRLMSRLTTNRKKSFVELKKGAAGLLEFPAEVKPGAGRLLWLLLPSQLMRLQ